MISDNEWDKINEKYGGLIYMIAHRIGGDKITNDFDDSVQEIRLSAMDAVRTYRKKTTDEFDVFVTTKDFDKYIKTCLWNRKNSNGTKIQKKAHIRNTVSLSKYDDLWYAEDDNCGDARQQPLFTLTKDEIVKATSGVDEMFKSFSDVRMDEETKSVVSLVFSDGKMIKPNGMLNINKIAQMLGKKKHQVKYIVNRLQKQLKDYNGN